MCVCARAHVSVCACVYTQVHLTGFVEFPGKDMSLFGMESVSTYLIRGAESQAGARSKNTTKMMLKRQEIVKTDNYYDTILF